MVAVWPLAGHSVPACPPRDLHDGHHVCNWNSKRDGRTGCFPANVTPGHAYHVKSICLAAHTLSWLLPSSPAGNTFSFQNSFSCAALAFEALSLTAPSSYHCSLRVPARRRACVPSDERGKQAHPHTHTHTHTHTYILTHTQSSGQPPLPRKEDPSAVSLWGAPWANQIRHPGFFGI